MSLSSVGLQGSLLCWVWDHCWLTSKTRSKKCWMLSGEELEATRHLLICPLLHVTTNAFRKQWQLCHVCLLNLTQFLVLAAPTHVGNRSQSSGTHTSQLHQADTTHSVLKLHGFIGFHLAFSSHLHYSKSIFLCHWIFSQTNLEDILMTCNSFNYPSIIGDLGCFLLFCVTNSTPVTLYAYKSLSVSLIFPGTGFLERGLLS